MKGLLKDLLWIIFPKTCAACGHALNRGEEVLCTHCRFHLPVTGTHTEEENIVVKRFWCKTPVTAAASYVYYEKGNKMQRLIHHFKYFGRREIGEVIGRMYGNQLKCTAPFSTAQVIIPVPLHASKKKKRGFNQSEIFAEGLSSAMQIPCDFESLIRRVPTETQTKKKRYNRFKNVNSVFTLVNHDAVRGKHILLVDDVVTTGSTLTACAEELLKVEGTRVSIATIACV